MAQTLADEYHGHKCARSPMRIPDISVKDTPEDAIHDSLYVSGEINRTEWLLHYIRKGEKWAETLLGGQEW